IVVTGLLPDVVPYFESVKLSVAPLRFGAGVKGKINQSQGLGVPVVATSLAAEGMDLVDHEDIVLANEPEEFARALIDLYQSEPLWTKLSAHGLEKTRARYSCEAVTEKLSLLMAGDHFRAPVLLAHDLCSSL
ncbi:MAG: glycosyltransferase family 4 protein, partial [Spartobacteria bacterium]